MPKVVKKTDENSNMVRQLSGLGIPHEQICSILEISKPTLYKYYSEELLRGKAQANAKVSENLFKIATGVGKGAVTACIFWLKTQAGWKETDVLEVNNVSNESERFRRLVEEVRKSKLPQKDSNKLIN